MKWYERFGLLGALALVVLCFLAPIGEPQIVSAWSQEADPPAAAAPSDSFNDMLGDAEPGFKDAMKDCARRSGLTFRQRRQMGLTFRGVLRAAKRIHARGELEGSTKSDLSVAVLHELMDENPKAFSQPGIDWDAILDFIERLIPLIMRIIDLFSTVVMNFGACFPALC